MRHDNDWTNGYVVATDYTYGYYPELNPLTMRLPLLSRGLEPPEVKTACELGFGQGISINIHAAASRVKWFGTDFNSKHAAFAQSLARASGANCHLFDQSFERFCAREDLPDFDFIGLHGVWSWISHENQDIIIDFLERKLKVGGVLYISYNTMPGWAPFLPLRELLCLRAGDAGAGLLDGIDQAIQFGQELLKVNPAYAAAIPAIGKRLETISAQNRHYLAHEYFNRDWEPITIAGMAKKLGRAKLDYACSAHWLDLLDVINVTPEQRQFLSGISNRILRETTRDFILNTQFRRDYWIKGGRFLDNFAKNDLLGWEIVILCTDVENVRLTAEGAMFNANLAENIYKPILKVLKDRQPHTLNEIAEKVVKDGVNFDQVAEAVLVLGGKGNLATAVSGGTMGTANRLNRHFEELSRASADFAWLASPRTGGGIRVDMVDQLFLLAMDHGLGQPQDWVNYVWEIFKATGRKMVKDGRALEGDEENLARLRELADMFTAKNLPILQTFAVADGSVPENV